MCVYIARDAKKLVQEGKSLREVRAYIDARYGGAGTGTPTPLPPA